MTKNSIALNRTLFLQDNLPILRGLDSDSIDLIATDPPFNKGVGAFEGTTKAGVDVEFKDVWNWDDDVHLDWMEAIGDEHPRLRAAIDAINQTAGDDMGAFICWMAVRVLEMHRALKPTGSIYLHCDPTASHYLKAMMDGIFGRKQFRNEIIWAYPPGGAGPKLGFHRKHDTILYYGKSSEGTFNREYRPLTPYAISKFTEVDEEGRKYKQYPGGRSYLDDAKGTPVPDWWTDIHSLGQTQSKERVGWPTQKPLALYKRMIQASSNPGDMVLDPFAGCATTAVAAEQLGRQWIGIDIREESGEVILERLQREVSESMAWDAIVRMPTEAPERTDDRKPAAPDLVLESPKRNAPRIPVREVRARLELRDGLRCRGCGWIPPYLDYMHVDHRKPKKEGGGNDMTNLVLLCEPCNRKKSYKLRLRDLQEAREKDGRMNMEWWETEQWK